MFIITLDTREIQMMQHTKECNAISPGEKWPSLKRKKSQSQAFPQISSNYCMCKWTLLLLQNKYYQNSTLNAKEKKKGEAEGMEKKEKINKREEGRQKKQAERKKRRTGGMEVASSGVKIFSLFSCTI